MPPLSEIVEILTFRAGFNTGVVVAGTALLGLAAGIVGVFAMLRKRSLVTDAVGHATLPGIAGAFLAATWLGLDGRSVPWLLGGAAIASVAALLAIHLILRHSRLTEDTAIAVVLGVFFGAGVVGLSVVQSSVPSNSGGIRGFIFGQAATMQLDDAVLMGGIALLAAIIAVLLMKEFALVCFNDGFAKVEGWPVGGIDLAMLGLTVLVTVAGLQAVGMILVVALLIIPAAAARFWTERVGVLIVIAGAIGGASGYLGSAVSALAADAPAGAVIIITSGTLFVCSMFAAPSRGVVATGTRRLRLRLKIAGDHFLEAAANSAGTRIDRELVDAVARTRGWTPLFRGMLVRLLIFARQIKPAEDGTLTLTDSGARRGRRVARNHVLWSRYLVTHADVAPGHIDWSADQVEHVLDESLIQELEVSLAGDPSVRSGGKA